MPVTPASLPEQVTDFSGLERPPRWRAGARRLDIQLLGEFSYDPLRLSLPPSRPLRKSDWDMSRCRQWMLQSPYEGDDSPRLIA